MIAIYKGTTELYDKCVTYGPVYFMHGQQHEIFLDHSNPCYSVIINVVECGQIIAKIPYNKDWKNYWEVIHP